MDAHTLSPALTPAQAAEALGVSLQTVYRMIDRGSLRALRDRRVVRIARGEIDRVLRGEPIGESDSAA